MLSTQRFLAEEQDPTSFRVERTSRRWSGHGLILPRCLPWHNDKDPAISAR